MPHFIPRLYAETLTLIVTFSLHIFYKLRNLLRFFCIAVTSFYTESAFHIQGSVLQDLVVYLYDMEVIWMDIKSVMG